jgi:hypothetical protein
MNKETLFSNLIKLLLGIIGFFIVNSYNNLRQAIMTFQTDIKKLEISVLELQVKLETYATKEEVRNLIDAHKN